MNQQRLSKVLASAGVASRRAAERLIFDGRVSVNGAVVLVPQTPVSLETDVIEVDGERVGSHEERVCFVLNKPAGYLCSNKPIRRGDRLVIELFEGRGERLFTVGRLDKDTTGLLLVTNDGDLANRIIHPSANLEKEYVVTAEEPIKSGHLSRLNRGAHVEGCYVRPVRVWRHGRHQVHIVIKEGKKREVRRLAASAGLTVEALKRIRIGGLRLPSIPEGSYRPLNPEDLRALFSERDAGREQH